jgi:putative acetyltransferase
VDAGDGGGGSRSLSHTERANLGAVQPTMLRPMAPADHAAVKAMIVGSNEVGGRSHYDATERAAFAAYIAAADMAELASGADLRVAVVDGEVVGCAGWVPFPDEPATSRLTTVFVAPHWFGRGVGTALVGEVEHAGADAGYPHHVVRSSLNAISFYERLGYVTERPWSTPVADGVSIGSMLMRKTRESQLNRTGPGRDRTGSGR